MECQIMKKLIALFGCMLVIVLSIYIPVYAASVLPQTMPGNDANPMDYTPPEGCFHYVIPNSNMEGSHTITFDENGFVDPEGAFSFTAVVGMEEGEEFTKVLSWSSNFPIYAVIVKGGPAFNLYQYDMSVRGDTDLVAPINESGMPADVSHVSVVICPEDFPPTPPIPTPTPSPCHLASPCHPLSPRFIGNSYHINYIIIFYNE